MLLLTLALACSDYDLKRGDDLAGGADTAHRPEGETCPSLDFPPEAVPADAGCALAPQTGQFYPEIQWHMDSFAEQGSSTSIMATPMVAHVTDDDGDGVFGSAGDVPDIAVITFGGANVLRVISGDGSGVHWSVWEDDPQGQSQPAIGDIDGDGAPEIVVATYGGRLVAYNHDGSTLWRSASFEIGGGFFGDDDDVDFDGDCTAPAISDMDGDGRAEVIAGRVILDGPSGATLGVGDFGIGRQSGNVGTTSFAVDIDLDGEQELITGNAFYRMDGSLKNLSGDIEDGYVAVGNLDGDDEGELVVVRSGEVTAYQHNFDRLWGPVALGSSQGGPPTIADFDGDGAAEIGVASASLYTVLDTDGSTLWSREVQDGTSGVTGSSVFDFEGDGIAEVVYADETRLWVFNGPDGAIKLESTDHTSNTWLENPTIADVDGDGHADIVLGHNAYQGEPVNNFYGLTVIADQGESWLGTRQIWNQHAYHITNISDDATVPADPEINWLSYNNFRSGDLHAGQGSAATDLVPEILAVCEDCEDGRVYLWARARNEGAAATVPGVTLSVYSGAELLDEVVLSEPIPAGMSSAGVVFELAPESLAGLRLVVSGGTECDDTNNSTTWEEPACRG